MRYMTFNEVCDLYEVVRGRCVFGWRLVIWGYMKLFGIRKVLSKVIQKCSKILPNPLFLRLIHWKQVLKDSSESTVFKANPLKEKCLINRRFGNLFSKHMHFRARAQRFFLVLVRAQRFFQVGIDLKGFKKKTRYKQVDWKFFLRKRGNIFWDKNRICRRR